MKLTSPKLQPARNSHHRSIERVLAAWRKSPPKLAADIERDKAVVQKLAVHRLVKASRSLKRPEFDPFLYCGVIPLERYTRDFFAAMFDARAPHGIAASVFEAFLEEIESINKTAVDPIRAALVLENGAPPTVKTEVALTEAIPDVLILGRHFLIAIEIKRRLGVETRVAGIPQSTRLRRSARIKAKEMGISPDCALVVFLTPEGKAPADSAVIPVRTPSLFKRIERKISSDRSNKLTTETKQMIKSYMTMLVGRNVMTDDNFTFYAKHYSDIGHLLNLEDEVQERYPDELWKMLQKTFSDRFSAGKFAGQSGWKCSEESDGPDDSILLWNPHYYDAKQKRGPYFSIDPLSASVTSLSSFDKLILKPLVSCSLTLEKNGGVGGVTFKSLVAAAQKDAPRLRKQFEEVSGEPNNCFVLTSIGDLLHISAYGSRQKNFEEMFVRVEKLVQACIPVIEKARQ